MYDVKVQESNRLVGQRGLKGMHARLAYLMDRCGSDKQLRRVLSGNPTKDDIRAMVEDEKDKEALVLIQAGKTTMCRFLIEAYGSKRELVETVRVLRVSQKGRRKTRMLLGSMDG